ncbi:hypothetical protein KFE25_011683 [Diacronema lutheri]|uniref:mitogen-activated protein kinase kinase n=2 Tax=Diacronema lutheri TaxID=2081491 RepID=A0A8J5X7W4_DIALT|nr:hypothetical protein KFE25_011659 [Diacronema lutheri]KAG8458152.1 hypothetical protein KFE25_011683 [Diacronema lutheri]
MAPPLGLSIESEADLMNISNEQGLPPLQRGDSFNLSDTGTFQRTDFKVSRDGIGGLDISGEERRLRGVKILLDDLEMTEELGQGASGIVRKAIHKPTGVIVAVKTVNITDKGKRSQMVNELRSLTQSQCPFLVGLHDAFYEEMQVHMVLEFMDGGDLSDLVRASSEQNGGVGGIRSEEVLFKIATQVLHGLSYLHRQRHQVHRDMKPANLMRTKDGRVKISDFGISSSLDSTMGMCSTFVGTANYMSPERLSGAEYSYPSDIWSFGLIVLELIRGAYPYPNASNYFQLLNNIIEGDVPAVPQDAGLSADLCDFVASCLRKEPAQRPTVTELQAHRWMKRFDSDEMDLSMKLEDVKL